MSQITRSNHIVYIDGNLYNNPSTLIRGDVHNKALRDLIDSIIWYDERRNAINFPYSALEILTGYSGTTPDGVYIMGFDPGSNPSISANQGDIITVTGTPNAIYATHANFSLLTDYVIYNEDTETMWHYDYRKDAGSHWVDKGEANVYNHNQQNTLQGGSSTERYHMTAAEYTTLQGLQNFTTEFYQNIVDGVYTTIGAVPSATGVYLVGSGSSYDLILRSCTPGCSDATFVGTPLKSYFAYVSEDSATLPSHVFYYNITTGKWEDADVMIMTNHNLIQNLQGGNGSDEYYHMTADEHGDLQLINKRLKFAQYEIYDKYTTATPIVPTFSYFIYNNGSKDIIRKYDGSYNDEVDPSTTEYNYWILVADSASTLSAEHMYIYNHDTKLFEDAGKKLPVNHNNVFNIQGGIPTERYHLTEAEYNSIFAILYSQTIYVDTISGDDSNDGLSVGNPIQTLSHAPEICTAKILTIILISDGNYDYDDDFVEAVETREIQKIVIQPNDNGSVVDTMVVTDTFTSGNTNLDNVFHSDIDASSYTQDHYITNAGAVTSLIYGYEDIANVSNSNIEFVRLNSSIIADTYSVHKLTKVIKIKTNKVLYGCEKLTFGKVKIESTTGYDVFNPLKMMNVAFEIVYIDSKENSYSPKDMIFTDVYLSSLDNKLVFENKVSFTTMEVDAMELEVNNAEIKGGCLYLNNSTIKNKYNTVSNISLDNYLIFIEDSHFDTTNEMKLFADGFYMSKRGDGPLSIFETYGGFSLIGKKNVNIFLDNIAYNNSAVIQLIDTYPTSETESEKVMLYDEEHNVNITFNECRLNQFKQQDRIDIVIPDGAYVDMVVLDPNIYNTAELEIYADNLQNTNDELAYKKMMNYYAVATTGAGTTSVIDSFNQGANITIDAIADIGGITHSTIKVSNATGDTIHLLAKIKRMIEPTKLSNTLDDVVADFYTIGTTGP